MIFKDILGLCILQKEELVQEQLHPYTFLLF